MKNEKNSRLKILKIITIYIFGALIYGIIEIANRGFTHITMGILGGFSFLVIHILNGERLKGKIGLLSVLIVSSFFITSIEFLAGEYLNRILKLNIWSYRDVWLNVDEQICLPFTLIWFFLSFIGIIVDNFIRNQIFYENILSYIPDFSKIKKRIKDFYAEKI